MIFKNGGSTSVFATVSSLFSTRKNRHVLPETSFRNIEPGGKYLAAKLTIRRFDAIPNPANSKIPKAEAPSKVISESILCS